VSAADNLAAGLNAGVHRSHASISFEIQQSPSLGISRAYLFPDPTCSGGSRCGGRFVIDAPGDSVNVLLRLYTVTGRLIRTLRSYGSAGQSQIPWDGLDEEGDRLANGVYLFKVHVYGRQSDGSSSPSEKAVADGRLVIVNH
jgi:flagellar hook assembly protein FlgD